MANAKPGQPLDVKTQARAAELIGLGLSQREAAGACGISESSVERVLRKPEYKKLADDVRRKRTSVTAQAAAVVSELLAAVDDNGDPAMGLRKMGAELVMKNPALLEQVEDLDGDESLLPGVVLRFPWQNSDSQESRVSGARRDAEHPSAPGEQSANGITLPEPAPPPGETPNLPGPESPLEDLIEPDEPTAFEPIFEPEPDKPVAVAHLSLDPVPDTQTAEVFAEPRAPGDLPLGVIDATPDPIRERLRSVPEPAPAPLFAELPE